MMNDVVQVELSPAQVQRLLGDASAAGYVALPPSRLSDCSGEITRARLESVDGRLSRSLLQGLWLLAEMPTDGSYVRVTEIARTLAMSQSTAHRYLSTLVFAGLVERDPTTRLYSVVWRVAVVK
jgi:hypothetical protein